MGIRLNFVNTEKTSPTDRGCKPGAETAVEVDKQPGRRLGESVSQSFRLRLRKGQLSSIHV